MENLEVRLADDLLCWERDYFSTLTPALTQTPVTQPTLWIIARNWRQALKRLPRSTRGRVFVSVLGLPPRGGWFSIFRNWNPRPDLDVRLLAHTPFALRYYAEMEKVPADRVVLAELPAYLEPPSERGAGPLVVGVMSHFASDANFGLLASVAHYVHAKDPSIRFEVIGGGALESHLDALLRDLGLAGVSRAPGRMPEFDVLLKVDLKAEHFLPFLWCAARGIPALTVDLPGADRYIVDNHDGFIVPMNEAKPLGELLLRFASQPGLAPALGAQWRQALAKRFALDRSLAALRALFQMPQPALQRAA